jgi:hypothetical protein
MVQLSATRFSYIATLRVSLVSFASITLCVASQRVFIVVVGCCSFRYRLSPETFVYALVHLSPFYTKQARDTSKKHN